MCVIAYKPAGVEVPSKKILQKCFTYNKDGAGFMFYDPNKDAVVIIKGLMTFQSFWETLKNVRATVNLKEVTATFHFRIGTHGIKSNPENTHPFPLTGDEEMLKAQRITTKVSIAHNGIISGVKDDKDVLSDTQVFIRDTLYPLSKGYPLWFADKAVQNLIADRTNSKFVVQHKNAGFMIGNFIKDNGVFYSNNTYKPVSYSYPVTETGYWTIDPDTRVRKWVSTTPPRRTQGHGEWLDYKQSGKSMWAYILSNVTDNGKYVGNCNECGLDWQWCNCGHILDRAMLKLTTEEIEYLIDEIMYYKQNTPLKRDLQNYLEYCDIATLAD